MLWLSKNIAMHWTMKPTMSVFHKPSFRAVGFLIIADSWQNSSVSSGKIACMRLLFTQYCRLVESRDSHLSNVGTLWFVDRWFKPSKIDDGTQEPSRLLNFHVYCCSSHHFKTVVAHSNCGCK